MVKTRSGVDFSEKKPVKECHVKLITKATKEGPVTFTIKGTKEVIRAKDCVLMRPSEDGKPPYVARVEKIEKVGENNVMVHCRWFYRPEDSTGGRKGFHGDKELYLSDHYDVQSALTIEGKCIVHTYKNYTKLKDAGPDDYYFRYTYEAFTGAFPRKNAAVYCICEKPYNPDILMVQCEFGCRDWFHPACVGMTVEESTDVEYFLCAKCTAKALERSQNGITSPPPNGRNVGGKRRRRI